MSYWMALACRTAREAQRRKQVHIAAGADVDQSTIARFERAIAWPRQTDRVIAAYADDLGTTPRALWAEAMRLWTEHDERTAR